MANEKDLGFNVKLDGKEQVLTGLDQIKKSAKESKDVFGAFPGVLGEVASAFGSISEAIKVTTISTNLFKTALIGTGIGAIVVLLGSLISYFQQTGEGADSLSGIMAGFSEVLKPVKIILREIGETISWLIEKIESWIPGMSEAASAAKELSKANRELKEAQSENSIAQAKTNEDVTHWLRLSKDVGYTYQQRIEFAAKAKDAANAQALADKNLADQTVTNAKKKLELDKQTGQSSKDLIEDQEKLNEAVVAGINAQSGYEAQVDKSNKVIDSIIKKRETEEAAAEKKKEEARKKSEQDAENRKNFLIQLSDQILEHEGTDLEKATGKAQSEYDKRIADIQKLHLKGQQLTDANAEAVYLRDKEIYDAQVKDDTKKDAEELKRVEKFQKDQQKIIDEAIKEQEKKEKEEADNLKAIRDNALTEIISNEDNKKISHVEALIEKEAIDLEYFNKEIDRLTLLGNKEKEIADLEKKIAAEKKATDAALLKNKQAVDKAYLQSASSLLGDLASISNEGSKQQKDLLVAQALINTYFSASAAFASGTEVGGPILGAVEAAVAVAAGLLQVKKIEEVKIPSKTASAPKGGGSTYGYGGIANGASHDMGGINATLEGGEAIINKNSTSMYKGILSAINTSGGGLPFDDNNSGSQPGSPSQPPIKTYVVASDVTNHQEAAEKIKRITKL